MNKYIPEPLDMRDLDWPTVEFYKHDHGNGCAALAMQIAEAEGLTISEQRLVYFSAFFHDIGRTAPVGVEDPSHARRGAAIVEKWMQGHYQYWSDALLRETVCRVIANHSFDRPLDSGDRVATVVRDADRLESARFWPGTPDGFKKWKANADKTLCATRIARDDTFRMLWRRYRGWKTEG